MTKKPELISIELPLYAWEQISSASITVADWLEIEYGIELSDSITEPLRKLYFTIKKETR